ncbi:hypothetical protein [Salinarimonas soli]|uniref:Uncharacterized protein n=1 Tax=Salinarimonas soli TaxID=1638099 RepID=A0A5B2VRD6_9HYPH|nr:hypothetical protein [Salinarimonas soli]KAA2241160.1 hypothetical protein F0L46_05010 [Salinarimonas soli]
MPREAEGKSRFMLAISITVGAPRKIATPMNDNLAGAKSLTPVGSYVVRQLARRSGLTPAHAMLIAELAGLTRDTHHG